MQKRKYFRKTIHNIIQAFKYVFKSINISTDNNYDWNLFQSNW